MHGQDHLTPNDTLLLYFLPTTHSAKDHGRDGCLNLLHLCCLFITTIMHRRVRIRYLGTV